MPTNDELNDADIKAADPSMLVKLSAALSAITGVLIALCGLQLVIQLREFLSYEAWLDGFQYGLSAGGVLQLAVATQVFRARPWAAFSGAGISLVMALAIAGWAVLSFPIGFFSCLVLVSTPLALLAAIFAFIAIGPVRHTAAARERLAAQGMGLGL